MSQSSPTPPTAPSASKTYQQGVNVYEAALPGLLGLESQSRSLYDPQRIAAQQGLQAKYGPTQYAQQLAALAQLDPTGTLLQKTLGGQIQADLVRGYVDPLQKAVYGQTGAGVGNLIRTTQADLGLGTQQSAPALRQEQQAIEAGQAARGNILGNAPLSAEVLYQGQRGQQLYQQRLASAQGALQGGQGFLGVQTPEAQSLAQAGSYLSLPTPEQRLLSVQGVSPDRSSAYVNPNAGYLGQQFGLQNYQNMLAQYAASGGSSNPWASALSGAASGAAAGAPAGPYGAVIGGAVGGLSGYFSDERGKKDIVKLGESTSGLPIYEFTYKDDLSQTRYRGTIAQELMKTRPDAVFEQDGRLFVAYEKIDIPFEEVR